jgi:hypothetical protein
VPRPPSSRPRFCPPARATDVEEVAAGAEEDEEEEEDEDEAWGFFLGLSGEVRRVRTEGGDRGADEDEDEARADGDGEESDDPRAAADERSTSRLRAGRGTWRPAAARPRRIPGTFRPRPVAFDWSATASPPSSSSSSSPSSSSPMMSARR